MLPWILAAVAIAFWTTALIWFFWRDIRHIWRTRNDKWYRPD